MSVGGCGNDEKSETNTQSETSVQPEKNETATVKKISIQQQTDIDALNQTLLVISAIETKINEDQAALSQDLSAMMTQPGLSDEAKVELGQNFKVGLGKLASSLEESKTIHAPSISNKDAQKYIRKAIDYHKKRSLLIAKKWQSLINGDIEESVSFGDSSNNMARLAASALTNAFNSLGVSPPVMP